MHAAPLSAKTEVICPHWEMDKIFNPH